MDKMKIRNEKQNLKIEPLSAQYYFSCNSFFSSINVKLKKKWSGTCMKFCFQNK